MDAQERRQAIARRLERARSPVSATALAREFSVSRQIIVGDVAILRAGGQGITATPRGYMVQNAPSGLVRQIDNIRRACPQVNVAGVLVTQWHRSSVGEDAVQTLREESPVPIFRTVIRRSDKAVESTWAREPVGNWSPFSAAARDYRAWVAELLEQEGQNHV